MKREVFRTPFSLIAEGDLVFWISEYKGEEVIKCTYVPVERVRCKDSDDTWRVSIWKRFGDDSFLGLYIRGAKYIRHQEWERPNPAIEPILHRAWDKLCVDSAFEELVIGVNSGRQ